MAAGGLPFLPPAGNLQVIRTPCFGAAMSRQQDRCHHPEVPSGTCTHELILWTLDTRTVLHTKTDEYLISPRILLPSTGGSASRRCLIVSFIPLRSSLGASVELVRAEIGESSSAYLPSVPTPLRWTAWLDSEDIGAFVGPGPALIEADLSSNYRSRMEADDWDVKSLARCARTMRLCLSIAAMVADLDAPTLLREDPYQSRLGRGDSPMRVVASFCYPSPPYMNSPKRNRGAAGESSTRLRSLRGKESHPRRWPNLCDDLSANTMVCYLCTDDLQGQRCGTGSLQCSGCKAYEDSLTTIMFRNIPNVLSRQDFLGVLGAHGFTSLCYDFVYLPMDFRRRAGYGYIFVNFKANAVARLAGKTLNGFGSWASEDGMPMTSWKKLTWSWGDRQGKNVNVAHYSKSPVMGPNRCLDEQPVVFIDGMMQPIVS